MAEAADMYLRRNSRKFNKACKTLTEPRSPLNIASDYVNYQWEINKTKMYQF